jgi:FKBP-type peptidyl-prolyl cis-trans isomerase FklB
MKHAISLKSLVLVAAAGFSLPTLAQLDTDAQKRGYSVGANIGVNLAAQGLEDELDQAALVAGIRDGLSGNLQMTESQVIEVLQDLQGVLQEKAIAAQEAFAQQGRDFLVQNGARDGVTTTASGLQYEVLRKSDLAGAPTPAEADMVSVHYHGTLVDGTVFDSSVDRGEPISFPVNGVIPGWTEALQLMHVGDKYRIFIPPELGYGANGVGPIPPNSVLVFDVELLDVQSTEL